MRWADVIALVRVDTYQDDEGGQHEGERVEREVFCNVGTLGLMTMAELRSSDVRITSGESVPNTGMHEMHLVMVRALDYGGEELVVFHGKEMDVVSAITKGENIELIIRRRVGNA